LTGRRAGNSGLADPDRTIRRDTLAADFSVLERAETQGRRVFENKNARIKT